MAFSSFLDSKLIVNDLYRKWNVVKNNIATMLIKQIYKHPFWYSLHKIYVLWRGVRDDKSSFHITPHLLEGKLSPCAWKRGWSHTAGDNDIMDTLLTRVTSHICLITGIKEGLNYIIFRVGWLKATLLMLQIKTWELTFDTDLINNMHCYIEF